MRYISKQTLGILLFMLVSAGASGQEENETESREKDETVSFAPTVAIKTNLLYDATATFNLGLEIRIDRRTTLDLPFNWNPFTYSDNRKWKHFLAQPEMRLWSVKKEAFTGHFFGMHVHYAYYNVGNLFTPPFSQYMADHRFEGWLAGAGVSYGYRWNISRHWGLEASIGGGYAYMDYDRFECGHCGEKLGSEVKHYFGPTKAGISLIYQINRKKATPLPPVTKPDPVLPDPVKEAVIYAPQFAISFVTPEVEEVKRRSEAGFALLDFAVGRSEIISSFRNNAAELQKIYTLIEQLRSDPDAAITGIAITGYASPEGTYQTNLTLSERRAVALKNQIKAIYGFPENLFTVSGRGEDWAMLDTLVSRSLMPEKYAILEIIRGTDIFDGREKKLMDLHGGNPYRRLKTDFFPQLRRSEYRLHYTVEPFTTERGKEVFRTNPSNLSLNEMFLVANTHSPGSDAFNEVFETAARIFPGANVANLNAAASAIGRNDAVSAARYLERVTERTAAYWNNAGILAFMQGDAEKAATCFARAESGNNGDAARNLEELEKHNSSKNR